jgi:hypothetical protein
VAPPARHAAPAPDEGIIMSTVNPQYPQQAYPTAVLATQPPAAHEELDPQLQSLRIYGHSSFLYWWPVWVTGYIMAILTYLEGVTVQIGNHQELFHPSKNLGVIYSMVFFFTILFTNVTVRGLASVVSVLAVMFLTVLFAYLGWWETILSWLPHLSVHMNLGFYIFFSTLIFVVWAFSTFVYDHTSFWVIRPGQVTQDFVVGGSQKSYDTRGMVFEKLRQDLFRQWILGFGSGDIVISTMGAKKEQLHIPNVLFVDYKVQQIQRLIAMHRNEFAAPQT